MVSLTTAFLKTIIFCQFPCELFKTLISCLEIISVNREKLIMGKSILERMKIVFSCTNESVFQNLWRKKHVISSSPHLGIHFPLIVLLIIERWGLAVMLILKSLHNSFITFSILCTIYERKSEIIASWCFSLEVPWMEKDTIANIRGLYSLVI